MENIGDVILPSVSEHSFPLDGGRPGWGCSRKYKSPLPLSVPVEEEDRESRNVPDSLIAAIFLSRLLLLATDVLLKSKNQVVRARIGIRDHVFFCWQRMGSAKL
jgi:hypothetical protein